MQAFVKIFRVPYKTSREAKRIVVDDDVQHLKEWLAQSIDLSIIEPLLCEPRKTTPSLRALGSLPGKIEEISQ